MVVADLRCHGDSAAVSNNLRGTHSLESAAADLIRLLSALKLFPEMLIGHSFGGKVVLQMTRSWAMGPARRVPRPVQVGTGGGCFCELWLCVPLGVRRARAPHPRSPSAVNLRRSHLPPSLKVWVLDALPGEVRSGDMGGADRPADLISTLQGIPLPVPSRHWLVGHLESTGFSRQVGLLRSYVLLYHALAWQLPGSVWATRAMQLVANLSFFCAPDTEALVSTYQAGGLRHSLLQTA